MFLRVAGLLCASLGAALPCSLCRAESASPAHLDAPQYALVSIAAGAVELRLPDGWVVIETPHAKELRVVLAPVQPQTADGMPGDGVWLVWHPRPPEWSERLDLAAMVSDRLRQSAGDHARLEEVREILVDGFLAVEQRFLVSADSSPQSQARQGFHLIVDTDWGLCELHAVAPATAFARRDHDFQQIVSSIALREPQAPRETATAAVRDAEPLLGAWKAARSRMRLHGDGRIEVLDDRPHRVQAESVSGSDGHAGAIRGRFEAEGDLVRVRWDDGSRLNFRWRLEGNDLLLTDHQGRISQLERLLE